MTSPPKADIGSPAPATAHATALAAPTRVSAPIRIGTASWSIPASERASFGEGASILARYASRFDAVEINSSFYRPHRPTTYAGWAASVPDGFRFAVKMPKSITHEQRLVGSDAALARFLAEVAMLGHKLGPLLIQLPPSLAFDQLQAEAFLRTVRRRFGGQVVCEPRHVGWFEPNADRLFDEMRVGRIGADPARVPAAADPGGWPGLAYHRLHGSPRLYYSDYAPSFIDRLSRKIAQVDAPESWCIFDNTAQGAATGNALALRARLGVDGSAHAMDPPADHPAR